MLNVYEQVESNKTRSTVVIVFFIAFIFGVAYLISYLFDLGPGFTVLALVLSTFSSLISYFYGDKIVLSLNHARPASREEFFDYFTVTENLALSQGLPKPQTFVIDSQATNAFATGRDPQHSVIAVTTGLLNKLNRTQLEGVIAHELSHIQNYDIRLMTIVSILIGSLSILINITTRGMFSRNRDRKNSSGGLFAIIGLVLIILAPLIAQLIQLAISRRREYLADASGVKITRQPQGLLEALKIIAQDPNPLESASTATASLYIKNPFKGNKIASLFSTHPPIEERIKALEQML
ncbi:MAG: M48 family metalloprotease [Patescibacteria group bacterium]|jgi:heat shock protein HtpX